MSLGSLSHSKSSRYPVWNTGQARREKAQTPGCVGLHYARHTPASPHQTQRPNSFGGSLLPGNGGPGLWCGSEGCLEAPGGGAGTPLPLPRPPRLPPSAAARWSLRPAPRPRGSGRRAGRGRARARGEPGPHRWVPKVRWGPGAGRVPARHCRPCPAPTRGTPAEPGARRRGDVQSRGPRLGLRGCGGKGRESKRGRLRGFKEGP